MGNINLQEEDLAQMRLFYQEEYTRLYQRLLHLKNVLNKLGVQDLPSVGGAEGSVADESSNEPVPATPQPKRKRQRPGRKSMWETILMNRLKEVGRPMTYNQITDEIVKFSKLPDSKWLSTKQAVLAVAFRLRTRDDKVDTFSVGNREKYLGLRSWFDTNGIILPEYREKIVIDDREEGAPKEEAKPAPKKPAAKKPAARGRKKSATTRKRVSAKK